MEVIDEKPIVIGCISNYGWSDIEAWVISLRQHYNGDVVLLCWPNCNSDIGPHCRKYKIKLVDVSKIPGYNASINLVVLRFRMMWQYLIDNPNYTHILTTDVKDVVFQDELDFKDGIYLTQEGFTYGEEPWSKNNILTNYGEEIYHYMSDFYIVCAGIIAGSYNYILPLFLNTYLMSMGVNSHSQGGGGPDQTALNLLLKNTQFDSIDYRYGDHVHLGTTYPALASGIGDIGYMYVRGMLEPTLVHRIEAEKNTPITLENGLVCMNGKPWKIVHQYDRVLTWNEIIRNKYKGK